MTVRPFRVCRTVKPPVLVSLRMVHRSPFFTQSVAVIWSLRSFAGDDQIADTRRIAVGQLDLPAGSAAGETVIGALVEAADQLTGGGQHDRVQVTAAAFIGLAGAVRRCCWRGRRRGPVAGPGRSRALPARLSRSARVAAASDVSAKRCSSVSRSAPWLAWMSRTPPAPIAASC